MNKTRKKKFSMPSIIILIITILAFGIRVGGINYHSYGDETAQIYKSLQIGLLDFSENSNIGAFSFINFIILGIYYIATRLVGINADLNEFIANYYKGGHDIFVVSRLGECIAATLSIIALYNVGKEIFNKKTGIIAALFLSFSFIPVQISQIARGQSYCLLFILIAIYYTYKIIDNPGQKNYIIAALATGSAVSIRIFSLIAIIPGIVLCHYLSYRRRKKPKKIFINLFLYLIVSASAFLFFNIEYIINPFAMISDHINSMNVVTSSAQSGIKYIGSIVSDPALYYFLRGFPFSVGWIVYTISILGMVHLACRKRWLQFGIITSFIIPYVVLLSLAGIVSPRYLFPVIPILILSGAWFINEVIDNIKLSWRKIFYIIPVIIIIPQGIKIIKYDINRNKTTTLELSREWIFKNIPDGARVAVESMGYMGPPLNLNRVLDNEIYNLSLPELKKLYMERQKKGPGSSQAIKYFIENPPYPKYYIINLGVREPVSIEILQSKNPEYVVTSSMARETYNNPIYKEKYPDFVESRLKMYEWLEKKWFFLNCFKPSSKHPGPEIRVYKKPD